MFTLHPQLEKDTHLIGDLPLSRLLLMNDVQYPWVIQVPMRDGIREAIDLSESDQQQLWLESLHICRVMKQVFAPDKLNVAALGNMVPQLHVHHVARFETDIAWPKPIWGLHAAVPYDDSQLKTRLDALQPLLTL